MAEREVVRQVGAVTTGWFRCQPGQPGFGGGTVDRPIVVFPRTAVAIRHRRRGEVVADPTVAMFYNRGDRYHRRPIDPLGDRCEWLSVPQAWWEEVSATGDPARRASDARAGDGRVFLRDHGPVSARTYLRQRRLTTTIRAGTTSRLAAEEAALEVLRDVVATAAGHDDEARDHRAARASTRASRRRLVDDVREHLAVHADDDHGLADVAAAVGASPFHLSRVFRAHTGVTIHQYRLQLRVRSSLERLDGDDLAAIAADLGFTSHSHYTATFRRVFGHTPSQVRAAFAA